MTAPMALTDDERKRQEQLCRIVEQETSATMSARYNAKRELEALKKLSDARAALRCIADLATDLDGGSDAACGEIVGESMRVLAVAVSVAAPHSDDYDVNDLMIHTKPCNCRVTTPASVAMPTTKHCACCLASMKLDPVYGNASAFPDEETPAPVAVPADCEVDSISSRVCEHGTKSCVIGHDDRIASAYAECARIADMVDAISKDKATHITAREIKRQIEAAALRAGVKP